jgi:DNA-binding XRE family transcriptional regulator
LPVYGIFFTKPKIKYIIKHPRVLPDGYPMRAKTIGERIRKKRLDMGLFQEDVAKIIGVDVNTVTNWEKGRFKPCKECLGKVMEFLESQMPRGLLDR